ncbi:unnamed protein product (macronuclear) [Paramecium tetraurelia]|uniref:Uncharacterized protein n=1 Tax=Paramecium tetraurelia TaxID=5888 RepID=A0C6Y7_PARTE|nr:uncharacterized protein GSPATT00035683001 [Paramecium tetraurelia]CAK66554.1 unnamed protein product [Paramecium tetraurelia]|eukprot:XP_001433951.1 hypothetical protein (macronuclear) [Paramecium tetraurelia strain d4-2]
MSGFMRLTKINRLMQRSEENMKNLKSLYAPQFNRGYDDDLTVIGRMNWMKIRQPKMYPTGKEEETFQARNIQRFPELRDSLSNEIDQVLEFLKLRNNEKLSKTLKNVKGNNVDEKIFRAMEYDINSFKQLEEK